MLAHPAERKPSGCIGDLEIRLVLSSLGQFRQTEGDFICKSDGVRSM